MKLNLGCGGLYKKDYLNIDAFDDTVADKNMSALDLKLKDNSIEKIEASQLIEHLGLMSSIYALSECFRVLKLNGVLDIETPDIKTSFKKYIIGDREDRKNLLTWIYGLETPGMQHIFCFPDDLLEEILKKIGFTNIKKIFYEVDKHQPILKITCKKTSKNKHHQLITHFRKKIIQNKGIIFQNQILTLEQEKLIDIFTLKIKEIYKNKEKNKILDEIITEGAVHSPKMTYYLLKIILEEKLLPQKTMNKYLDTIKILIKYNFPSILNYSFTEIPEFVGEQKRLYQTIKKIGKSSIKNLLNSSKRTSTIESLSKMNKKLKTHHKIDFFSEQMLIMKANLLFRQGAKEFILKNYKKAINKFEDSIKLHRDQILSYWNLARLYKLSNDKEQSKIYYKNTIDILKRLDIKNKTAIKKSIENEINKTPHQISREPIFFLKNIQ